ncbi:unnamed protein product, partial [Amoebophrya sp. A25]|eukprot:GSA25T00017700001.1
MPGITAGCLGCLGVVQKYICGVSEEDEEQQRARGLSGNVAPLGGSAGGNSHSNKKEQHQNAEERTRGGIVDQDALGDMERALLDLQNFDVNAATATKGEAFKTIGATTSAIGLQQLENNVIRNDDTTRRSSPFGAGAQRTTVGAPDEDQIAQHHPKLQRAQ